MISAGTSRRCFTRPGSRCGSPMCCRAMCMTWPRPEECAGRAAAVLDAMPVLADPGYEGAGHGVHVPVKKPAGVKELNVDTRARNALICSVRCLGERGLAPPTQRGKRSSMSPPARQDRPHRPRGIRPGAIRAQDAHVKVVGKSQYVAHYYNGRRPHRSRQLHPPRPDHPVADLPRSGSRDGPSSAASSTNTSGPHRSQGQDRWPSSGTPQERSAALPPSAPHLVLLVVNDVKTACAQVGVRITPAAGVGSHAGCRSPVE